MSNTYQVIAGDTFDSIARKVYGFGDGSSRIAQANPGASEPLVVGTALVIPVLPEAPIDAPSATQASSSEEVAVLVDGVRFRYWNTARITRSLDRMDTFELEAVFEPDNVDLRSAFKPFSFSNIQVFVGGAPLFTGTLMAVSPFLEQARRVIVVNGYSLPGVLNDCTASTAAYPVEFNAQTIAEIGRRLAAPFGVGVQAEGDTGSVFERVAIAAGKKVLSFLVELAQQRNLVVSSTALGALLFWRAVETGLPVASLSEGSSPLVSITPTFNIQNYYSHITGIEPVLVGLKGAKYTVKNSLLEGVTRPYTFTVPDTFGGDLAGVVRAKASRMFGDMVSYSAVVSTWRDSSGELWEPNTTIRVRAPGAMIYSDYEFIIRGVVFERDATTETAVLSLVLPGAFSGAQPTFLPWGSSL